VTVNKGRMHVLSLYLPGDDFYMDMPDDGLRKGRNMLHKFKAQFK